MLCSFAASITSLSLIDPPGCIIAVIPCLAASSTQSLNGKKRLKPKRHHLMAALLYLLLFC